MSRSRPASGSTDPALLPWSLSEFQVVEELFRSPTGCVLKARRRADDVIYVLKERRMAELGAKEDVLHEVKLLARVKHPNVIRCYGYFHADIGDTVYIVLEYAALGDLYREVTRRKAKAEFFSEEEIWQVFEQCCSGLEHLHSLSIVHRDIKTLNILRTLAPDGSVVVKLADLGVGRQMSVHTVMLQTFYGTPLYASPELCENAPYNEKTDIWSLGVVLYELAALTPPFTGRSLMALAKSICSGEYPPLPSRYSPGLSRLIGTMLNTDHRRRPSASRVMGWLKDRPRVSSGVGVAVAPSSSSGPALSPSAPTFDPKRVPAAGGGGIEAGPIVVRVARDAKDPTGAAVVAGGGGGGTRPDSVPLRTDEAIARRGGEPMLSTGQRQRLETELKRRKVQAKRMEQALKAAVEQEGSSWDDVASDAGFTFLWETETPLVSSRPPPLALSYRSNTLILRDIDALKRVHDDIFDMHNSLSGRSVPTTAEHSGRLSSGPTPLPSPSHAPSAAVGPGKEGRGGGGGVGGGGKPTPPVDSLPERVKGIALSDRDTRWEKRRMERGAGPASPVLPPFHTEDSVTIDAGQHRPGLPSSRDGLHRIGRAGSEVVLNAAGSGGGGGGTVATPATGRTGATTARYNVITGQFESLR